MLFSILKGSLAAAFLCGFTLASSAQPHFANCASRTGSNATLLIPAVAVGGINGRPLEHGTEIAIFTPERLCAGVARWDGKSLGITLWGDNPYTSTKEGFHHNDLFELRIWSPNDGAEYAGSGVVVQFSSAQPFLRAEATYVEDAIYVVETLSVHGEWSSPTAGGAASHAVQPVPNTVTLRQNFPNPFYPSTTISYDLRAATNVRLEILNLHGQAVTTLVSEHQTEGYHELPFAGSGLPSGTYFYRLTTDQDTHTKKMVLLR